MWSCFDRWFIRLVFIHNSLWSGFIILWIVHSITDFSRASKFFVLSICCGARTAAGQADIDAFLGGDAAGQRRGKDARAI